MSTPMQKTAYVIMDGRFLRTAGKPSSYHLGYDRFGVRYTKGYTDVKLVARVADKEDPDGKPLEGPGVEMVPLPNVRNLRQLLVGLPQMLAFFWKIPRDAAVILRIPGIFPSLAWLVLLLKGHPYGVEVVADPADAFAKGAVRHPMRPLLAWGMIHLTRLQCRYAASTAYVTKFALQRRYSPAKDRPTFDYTSLDMKDEMFTQNVRTAKNFEKKSFTLVNVAMMQKFIKGQDTLLEAFAALMKQLPEFHLTLRLVGDGDSRHAFEKMAKDLGIAKNVVFTGRLAGGDAVRAELDAADIFVLPSRQEGLPRAMLEAMARALPCVSTRVGGADELLTDDFLVPADDAAALTRVLAELMVDAEKLAQASHKNLGVAGGYHSAKVMPERVKFYQSLGQK